MKDVSIISLIPEGKLEAFERALRTAFGTTDVESIELLTGGYSSALVYRIVVGGSSYVLRIVMQRDAFRDPARQFACMKIADEAGIAPHVHYTNTEDALSITDFIATAPGGHSLVMPAERLIELAEILKRLHAAPIFPPLVNFLDGIDGFIKDFHASGLLPASATEEHFRHYAAIQRAYPRHDPDLVSSHNDLNVNNILFDGNRIWIIDWEAAFRNDRYADLAIAANSFMLDEAGETPYLAAYFGDALDDYKRARFFLMRQICNTFYGVVFMRMAAATRSPDSVHDDSMDIPPLADVRAYIGNGDISLNTYEGKLLFAKAMLNEALGAMKTPRFSESIVMMEKAEARS